MKYLADKGALPESARHTLSRRSVIDWIGRATVLALSNDLLTACSGETVSFTENDAGRDALTDADEGQVDPWAFHPPATEPAIYEAWNVRTVDQ